MKKRFTQYLMASLILAVATIELSAQQQFGVLNGIVADSGTGETVPFASVAVKKGNGEMITGGISNLDGEVKVDSIPLGKVTIEVSFMGYETLKFDDFQIVAGKNSFVALLEESTELVECVIYCCCFYIEEEVIPEFEPIELASYKAENPDLAEDGFIIFPNPANDVLFYEFTTDIASLQLVDFNGRILFDTQVSAFQRNQLLVASYPAGFYSLRFFQDGKWETEKIVVTH